MPFATASQAVMPPKTLTKTLLTCSSPRMTSRPGHDLGRRSAADVEEVGGLHAAVTLARVGDDVEGRHHESGAVADDSDLAVELDVVEVVQLGLGLERVGRFGVFQLGVGGVAEAGVLVERDLAVEGDDVARLGEHQRVDLDQRGILALVDLVELHENRGDLVDELRREPAGDRDLGGLGQVDAGDGVDLDAGEGVGALDRELLDLHAALDAAEREVAAVGPVEQNREVELLHDLRAGGHHDALDGVALDVEAQNRGCRGERVFRRVHHLHAAGFAAASGLDLSLDDDGAADLLGCCLGFCWAVGNDAGKHRHSVGLKEVPGLILEKIHVAFPIARRKLAGRPGHLDCEIVRCQETLTMGNSTSRVTRRLPVPAPRASRPRRIRARRSSRRRRWR